jgi:hypothetical protein
MGFFKNDTEVPWYCLVWLLLFIVSYSLEEQGDTQP